LLTPSFIAPARFTDPVAALEQVRLIYEQGLLHLRDAIRRFIAGEDFSQHVRACYPFVRVHTSSVPRSDSRLSYGFVSGAGTFETTLTRPDVFERYYLEQFQLLLQNHGHDKEMQLEIGTSSQPIPVHFAMGELEHVEGGISQERMQLLRNVFDLPDLSAMDDSIANGMFEPSPGAARPLSLFTAPRVDYSIHRLQHYTGTEARHFQNFVLFTNYQFYIDEFVRIGHEIMNRMVDPDNPREDDGYVAFVEPGNQITHRTGSSIRNDEDVKSPPSRLPQMPGYHLVRADGNGISMINIGVGPANAKTITDHVAVLRPHVWLMLGHCAGLRTTQKLGDYVLAHGYVREDHVLDEDLPLWVPIPSLAEVQVAIESAVAEITQLTGYELKSIMRTGTVASTDNRNWELLSHRTPERRFSQSRAIALDMESATIAVNGFRFRVPYGTLLCVSDKPLHGEIKLPGMADHFYRERVDQHLRIGIRALELLRRQDMFKLHSRKLRSFAEVAFQ